MPFLVVGAVAGGYLAGAGLLGTGIGILGGAVLGGLAGASIDARIEQQKGLRQQAAAQERQFTLQQKQADIQNVRSARAAFRQARIAQAAMTNVAYQTGGAGSTGLAGGLASAQTQTAGRIGQMTQTAQANAQIGEAGLQALRAGSNAAIYGTVGDITQTIFGSVGGFRIVGTALTG